MPCQEKSATRPRPRTARVTEQPNIRPKNTASNQRREADPLGIGTPILRYGNSSSRLRQMINHSMSFAHVRTFCLRTDISLWVPFVCRICFVPSPIGPQSTVLSSAAFSITACCLSFSRRLVEQFNCESCQLGYAATITLVAFHFYRNPINI